MTIAPVRKSVMVEVSAERAFDAFVGRMGDWWPKGKTIGAKPHVEIVIEPTPGGRWFERDDAGNETDWGRVLIWERPERVVLAWQLDASFTFNPSAESQLEMRFVSDDGGTRVDLEHRNLERLGTDAARVAEVLRGGWAGHMESYRKFVTTLEGSDD
jgi:hypothetical protein